MMTFNMVKRYVTSITNDASGSLASRLAVYGPRIRSRRDTPSGICRRRTVHSLRYA